MNEPFVEFASLLILAAVGGAIAVRLKQPILIAYIVVGVLVGPAGFSLVRSHDQIDLLAQVGVAVLLFVVGLRLDLAHVRHIGPVALATGLGQLAFTIAIGFVLVLALGKDWLTALYVAVALTFSSTIIIVKLLSDKRELDSLHGRIAVGFLIVQDLAVVLAMMGMSALRPDAAGAEAAALDVAVSLLVRIAAAALLIWLCIAYLLPPVVRTIARSQELLLVFAIAWGTALAALGEVTGFSKEAGAFLAGFSLASTEYRDAMSARLVGIRDFLLLFFFIDLGAKLELSVLGAELGPAMVLALFVLIGNPLIVLLIMGRMGYDARTGFLAGLTVAQISEFSIVFVAMGISLGHVGSDALGLTTLVGVVTIAASTYMILYSHTLYEWLAPWLRLFQSARVRPEVPLGSGVGEAAAPRVVVFGLGRYGARLLENLTARGVPVLGVDFDPENVRALRRRGLPARFGDAEDPPFVESLPCRDAAWVVSTLPLWSSSRLLLRALHDTGYRGRVAAVARDDRRARMLEQIGVDRVVSPYTDAADHAAEGFARELTGEGSPS